MSMKEAPAVDFQLIAETKLMYQKYIPLDNGHILDGYELIHSVPRSKNK